MRILVFGFCLCIGLQVDAGVRDLKLSTVERAVINAARKHRLDADLLMAIYKLESGLKLGAINKHTHDYGIAQVNRHTAAAYKLDKRRLLKDLQYSADAGALILRGFKDQYAAREPATWVCRYNLGSKPILGKRAELCFKYLNKVHKFSKGL